MSLLVFKKTFLLIILTVPCIEVSGKRLTLHDFVSKLPIPPPKGGLLDTLTKVVSDTADKAVDLLLAPVAVIKDVVDENPIGSAIRDVVDDNPIGSAIKDVVADVPLLDPLVSVVSNVTSTAVNILTRPVTTISSIASTLFSTAVRVITVPISAVKDLVALGPNNLPKGPLSSLVSTVSNGMGMVGLIYRTIHLILATVRPVLLPILIYIREVWILNIQWLLMKLNELTYVKVFPPVYLLILILLSIVSFFDSVMYLVINFLSERPDNFGTVLMNGVQGIGAFVGSFFPHYL